MAATKYVRTKPSIDGGRLHRKLKESAIETELMGVMVNDNESGNVEAWFTDELSSGDETIFNDIVASCTNVPLAVYKVWCDDCGDYIEDEFTEFPSVCPTCSGSNVDDVTDRNFAPQGKAVSTDMPSGFHSFQLSASGGNKWVLHRGFVPFQVPVTAVPSEIKITEAVFDGTASLIVEKITKRGFVFSVGTTGKAGNWGFTSVEFDWEAIA